MQITEEYQLMLKRIWIIPPLLALAVLCLAGSVTTWVLTRKAKA